MYTEPEFVVPVRVDEQSEYGDSDEITADTDNDELDPATSKEARMVIIATGILCGLLILVVTAILGKFLAKTYGCNFYLTVLFNYNFSISV